MAWENQAQGPKNGIFSDQNRPELVVFLQESDYRYVKDIQFLMETEVCSEKRNHGSKNASSNLPTDDQKAVSINTLEDLLRQTKDYDTNNYSSSGEERNGAQIHHSNDEEKNVAQDEQSAVEIGFHFHSIQCSSNVSIRSNSSTTSSGSFAFPILASEWNGSPERMGEPEKKRLRKRHWRKIWFFCGKF